MTDKEYPEMPETEFEAEKCAVELRAKLRLITRDWIWDNIGPSALLFITKTVEDRRSEGFAKKINAIKEDKEMAEVIPFLEALLYVDIMNEQAATRVYTKYGPKGSQKMVDCLDELLKQEDNPK